MMPIETPRQSAAASSLTFLFDSTAALAAAERLQACAEDGLRFCCEHREKLSLAEARRRDALDAQRRARLGEEASDRDLMDDFESESEPA